MQHEAYLDRSLLEIYFPLDALQEIAYGHLCKYAENQDRLHKPYTVRAHRLVRSLKGFQLNYSVHSFLRDPRNPEELLPFIARESAKSVRVAGEYLNNWVDYFGTDLGGIPDNLFAMNEIFYDYLTLPDFHPAIINCFPDRVCQGCSIGFHCREDLPDYNSAPDLDTDTLLDYTLHYPYENPTVIQKHDGSAMITQVESMVGLVRAYVLNSLRSYIP